MKLTRGVLSELGSVNRRLTTIEINLEANTRALNNLDSQVKQNCKGSIVQK